MFFLLDLLSNWWAWLINMSRCSQISCVQGWWGMPTLVYYFRINRMTFRHQSLYIHVLSFCPAKIFFFLPYHFDGCFTVLCSHFHIYIGHFLGVAASWLVQVGIEIYRFFSFIINFEEKIDRIDKAEKVKLLGKKVTGSTVKCGASLVFASITTGIGTTLFRPSANQWIGKYILSSKSTQ